MKVIKRAAIVRASWPGSGPSSMEIITYKLEGTGNSYYTAKELKDYMELNKHIIANRMRGPFSLSEKVELCLLALEQYPEDFI